jgi:putative hydrolase of the HAD superfamily
MLKAIVFDYGKVLTLPPTVEDWARLAGVFGASVPDFQEPYWGLREDYDRGVYTGDSYWRAVGDRLGESISQDDVIHLVALDNAQWTHENPAMLEFAWRAQEAGLKIGILSNMQHDMLAAMRKKLNWLDRFDAQIYSCEIGSIKPEPESYHAVLKALAVRPEESIFFDDKQVNIDGAHAVHIRATLFEGDAEVAYDAIERLGVDLAQRKAAD